ncbi:hypothetical protein AB0L44_31140 [Nonomuraea wenchangensis]
MSQILHHRNGGVFMATKLLAFVAFWLIGSGILAGLMPVAS